MSIGYLIPIEDAASYVAFWAEVINTHSTEDDVVLVPFAADTAAAEAALALNRRVVLCVRTPARQLRLASRLQPPSASAWERSLAQLAATTKRDLTLNTYINGLYETACPECESPVPASAFIWDVEQGTPVGKEVSCAACGFEGSAPANSDDAALAARFDARGLNYWFILEWLADAQDSLGRELARDLLDSYSPRNLTALADITRKIDAELADHEESQRHLRAAMLHALDAARQQPSAGHPGRVVERNVWQLLDAGQLPRPDGSVPRLMSDLSDFFGAGDSEGRIALVTGPIHRLARQLPARSVRLILGPPPSLDVDAWTCEQMWSRWVFGRGALEGLHPPVGGWPRHTRALATTLTTLWPALQADGRAVFRFQASNPDRASALLVAVAAHAKLEALVFQPPVIQPAHLFRAVGGTYQMTFAPAERESPALDADTLWVAIEDLAVEAARQIISARAEPLIYDWLTTAALARLTDAGLLHAAAELDRSLSPLAFVKQHVRQGLRAALADGRLVAVPAGPGDEASHWWLPRQPHGHSLADRVEAVTTERLDGGAPITRLDVYCAFPGSLTPEAELVDALLAAYGEQQVPGEWRRRATPIIDHEQVVDALVALGGQLHYAVDRRTAGAVWRDGDGGDHVFQVLEDTRWQEVTGDGTALTTRCYLVVSEPMADLLTVRLTRDPVLQAAFAARGCSIIKVHHLLEMAAEQAADRQAFKKIVGLDPIIEQAEAQIPLF